MDEFFNWIGSLNVLPKTIIGQAVYCANSQRKYLQIYLSDRRLEISNNRAERNKRFVTWKQRVAGEGIFAEARSEERRVGKEFSYRWLPFH